MAKAAAAKKPKAAKPGWLFVWFFEKFYLEFHENS